MRSHAYLGRRRIRLFLRRFQSAALSPIGSSQAFRWPFRIAPTDNALASSRARACRPFRARRMMMTGTASCSARRSGGSRRGVLLGLAVICVVLGGYFAMNRGALRVFDRFWNDTAALPADRGRLQAQRSCRWQHQGPAARTGPQRVQGAQRHHRAQSAQQRRCRYRG